MVYEARKLAADGRSGASIKLVNPDTGETYGRFFYADTETGLLKGWVVEGHIDSATGKGIQRVKTTEWKRDAPTAENPIGTLRRTLLEEELPGTLAFDVICRKTGEVLHRFRPAP